MARGFTCTCGGRMRVTSTRKVSRNVVVRYRKCERCGKSGRTEERLKEREPVTA